MQAKVLMAELYYFLFQLKSKANIGNIQICVVDNFQGEENDIILLSLVRSNEEGKVGFLRTDNRVCVALSRARHGFYIIGNMSQLCHNSNLWKDIKIQLKKQHLIGDSLIIKCENHSDTLKAIKKPDDFCTYSPVGGCSLDCTSTLKCGHRCPKKCHFLDKDHKIINCTVKVNKVLPCGHYDTIPCYKDPESVLCDKECSELNAGCTQNHLCKKNVGRYVSLVES